MNINLTCPINNLGYGLVGLNVALALSLKNNVSLWPIGPVEAPVEYHDLLRKLINNQASYDNSAPSLRIYHQFDLAQHVGYRSHVGFPFFELNRFKKREYNHLASQDHLIVASEWAKQVLMDNEVVEYENQVSVVPLGIDTKIFQASARSNNIPTVFMNVGKWEYRKGHDFLLEAFNRAFEPTDEVLLVMHCDNPFIGKGNQEWADYYMNSKLGKSGNIKISRERFSSQIELAKVMNEADCGVFPSRAEGWNFEPTEMMAMGKEVIMTDYSGHTAYAHYDNSKLIHIDEIEPADDGVFFHFNDPDWGDDRCGGWAKLGESQMEQCVEYMRAVHRTKQEKGSVFNAGGVATAATLTWERTAEKICEALCKS